MGIRLKTAVFLFLAVLFAVGAPVSTAEARGKKRSAKVRKHKKKKAKKAKKDEEGIQEAKIEEDPWADGEQEEAPPEEEPAEEAGEEEPEEPPASIETPKEESAMDSLQRSGRMEFDERLVKGQAAKSGAVYLFNRTPRRLPGLVPMRRSYRKRIVSPVLGERELKPVTVSDRKDIPEVEKQQEAGQEGDAEPTVEEPKKAPEGEGDAKGKDNKKNGGGK